MYVSSSSTIITRLSLRDIFYPLRCLHAIASACSLGKIKEECRAAQLLRLNADLTTVQLDDVFDNRQSQPGAAWCASAIDAVKSLEDFGNLLCRNADAIVGDGETPRSRSGFDHHFAAGWCVFYSV